MSKTLPISPFTQLITHWRQWWRRQTPNRQDRFAFIAPLAAVVLFMAAITTAFWYLRYEEIVREQEVAGMWSTPNNVYAYACLINKNKSCAWRVTLPTGKPIARLFLAKPKLC
jgi:hypothetical protein